ncbi:hypothetical protein FOA52_001817, partial [Chlamydomonas sp. UWO 241]
EFSLRDTQIGGAGLPDLRVSYISLLLAAWPRLRRLELVGRTDIVGPGNARGPVPPLSLQAARRHLKGLRSLPLEHLALRLPRLPLELLPKSLTSLELCGLAVPEPGRASATAAAASTAAAAAAAAVATAASPAAWGAQAGLSATAAAASTSPNSPQDWPALGARTAAAGGGGSAGGSGNGAAGGAEGGANGSGRGGGGGGRGGNPARVTRAAAAAAAEQHSAAAAAAAAAASPGSGRGDGGRGGGGKRRGRKGKGGGAGPGGSARAPAAAASGLAAFDVSSAPNLLRVRVALPEWCIIRSPCELRASFAALLPLLRARCEVLELSRWALTKDSLSALQLSEYAEPIAANLPQLRRLQLVQVSNWWDKEPGRRWGVRVRHLTALAPLSSLCLVSTGIECTPGAARLSLHGASEAQRAAVLAWAQAVQDGQSASCLW